MSDDFSPRDQADITHAEFIQASSVCTAVYMLAAVLLTKRYEKWGFRFAVYCGIGLAFFGYIVGTDWYIDLYENMEVEDL